MLVKKELDPEQWWFPESRFGMFVHFGLYALLGRGEWVMYHEKIPREQYEKLTRDFNPHLFDAREWVETARRAGARYITVTAKHHDGFCLFDSRLTDFKITNTPFGRDLIGELVEECQRQGMRILLYYSQPDWHHPAFVHRPGAFKDWQGERPEDDADWPAYQAYCHGQVEELCTNYGRIDGVWFDGVHKTEGEWGGKRLYELIRRHQPGAVVNERAGRGDFFTPERSLSALAAASGYTVESCQAICREHWGYYAGGTNYTSSYLVECLVRMAASNGNYLLNVGPKPDGTLPEDQVTRLVDIGTWLARHGEAIYHTTGCPMQAESDPMVYTRRGKRLFLHLLRWPEADAVQLNNLRLEPESAHLVGNGQRLQVDTVDERVTLFGLPASPPDPAVNVIELAFMSEDMLRPVPRPTAAPPVAVAAEGDSVLTAETGRCVGFGPKGSRFSVQTLKEPQLQLIEPAETAIVNWRSPEQTATWLIDVQKPGRYEVDVVMRCREPYAGSTFSLRVGEETCEGAVPATDGDEWKTLNLGLVELPAGRHEVSMTPKQLNYGYIFADVKHVILTRTTRIGGTDSNAAGGVMPDGSGSGDQPSAGPRGDEQGET